MSLITPGIGLIFWMSLAFIIVWGLLGKFAWKPIMSAIKERENTIDEALKKSSEAQNQVEQLNAEIADMKKSARAEREEILQEAKGRASALVADAEAKAKEEASKIVAQAQDAIQQEKNAAMAEIKAQIATLSLEIATEVIKKDLSADGAQKELVSKLLNEAKVN